MIIKKSLSSLAKRGFFVLKKGYWYPKIRLSIAFILKINAELI